MKEPKQYEVGPGGGLRLTQEWKEWRKVHLGDNTIKDSKSIPGAGKKKRNATVGRPQHIDPETHRENWKPVAQFSNSERRILFCCCQAGTGNPYSGCGAVAIQRSRGGALEIVIEPKFE